MLKATLLRIIGCLGYQIRWLKSSINTSKSSLPCPSLTLTFRIGSPEGLKIRRVMINNLNLPLRLLLSHGSVSSRSIRRIINRIILSNSISNSISKASRPIATHSYRWQPMGTHSTHIISISTSSLHCTNFSYFLLFFVLRITRISKCTNMS